MSETINGRGRKLVTAHTQAFSLTDADNNTVHTNAGAGAARVCSLPPALPGLEFLFVVKAAQELRLDPSGTETIALPSTGAQGAAGKYLSADAVGEWVRLICVVAGTWDVAGYAGTWTAEG